MDRSEFLHTLNELLHPENYRDYAPNGLQVQGRSSISRIVTGVSANAELIDQAIALNADAILVHHGWFWKHDATVVTGLHHARLSKLIKHDINLIGFHLPLDDHPELGNNALLGQALGFRPTGRFGQDQLGWIGDINPLSSQSLALGITRTLRRAPLVVGDTERLITRVAWCTGAAQDFIEEAAMAGADAFLSGEISERTPALAKELGITYFSCGHHATERFGIQALGQWLTQTHGLDVTFIDINNPV